MTVLRPTPIPAKVHNGQVVPDQPLPAVPEGQRAVVFFVDDALPEPRMQRGWARRPAWRFKPDRGSVKSSH